MPGLLGRTRTFRAAITEPEPGRVLVETIKHTGTFTTFSVDCVEDGARVRIASEFETRGGLLGGADVESVAIGSPSCTCVPEGFAQCVHLGNRKALHHFRVACEHVEAVEGPWDDEQFGHDARVDQTASIFDVLIDEEIDRADADESRRETLKLWSARGNSGGGYVCPTRIGAEEAAPAEAISLGRPD